MADRIETQHISTALTSRHEAADADTTEALRRLATGLLRQFHTGGFAPDLSAFANLLGPGEQDQFAQKTVDCYLTGRRDNPPFPQRPAMRSQLRQSLHDMLGRDATATEIDVVLNALVGAERDLVLAPSPAARMIIAVKLAEAFAAGA